MQARGDATGAFDLLDQINCDSYKARILVPAYRAQLYLAHAHERPDYLRNARRWAEGRHLSDCGPFWQAKEPLTLVRVQIAERRSASQSSTSLVPDLEPLMKFLKQQIQIANNGGWVERMVELRILQALLWQVQNRLPESVDSLQHALALAEPGGYLRVFLDEGLPMHRLLTKIRAGSDRINEYVGKLLAAGETSVLVPSTLPTHQSLVEPLSARELEVLRLMACGSSNAEIAQELVITLNTTKKHITHIFEKIGVTKRSEAVKRSNELELLTPSQSK